MPFSRRTKINISSPNIKTSIEKMCQYFETISELSFKWTVAALVSVQQLRNILCAKSFMQVGFYKTLDSSNSRLIHSTNFVTVKSCERFSLEPKKIRRIFPWILFVIYWLKAFCCFIVSWSKCTCNKMCLLMEFHRRLFPTNGCHPTHQCFLCSIKFSASFHFSRVIPCELYSL